MPSAFSQLKLLPELQISLTSSGFTDLTEIQSQALPAILEGKDVTGQAKTGSGKTLTFSLGILQKVDTRQFGFQALVLCPTRELADQVAEEIRKLGKKITNLKVLSVYGGAPIGPQINSLKHGGHVLVGTPGRVMDLILKGHLSLYDIHTFVLDEADRMLDMGFEKEMQIVMEHLPAQRQTLLFSATFPAAIERITREVQHNPVSVKVTATHCEHKIQQCFFEVESAHKPKACCALLSEYQPESCIVFCNTRTDCNNLADHLMEQGFSAIALNGDLEQKQRNEVIARFTHRSALILVATDVAARGLDIPDVGLIINYQPAFEAEVHIHRIGRTGRADKEGIALTLAAANEVPQVSAIEELQGSKVRWKGIQSLRFHANKILKPEYASIAIDGGKKAKLRPGDILGALTQDADVPGDDIGKIKITATHAYVAVKIRSVKRTLNYFKEGKIKGKRFKARKLR